MASLPSLTGFRPVRSALTLWVVVAVAIAVRVLVAPNSHTIFPVLAGSATHWWADQPLYANYAPIDFFRYPPIFAVGFTPFSLLGPQIGGVLWSLLSIAVFVLGLWTFARDVVPGVWTPSRQAAFLALGVLGAFRGLWNAQSNALAIGLLLLAASMLVRRRWWAAAGMLAASVLLKLTPLAPALLLCAIQPRRLTPRLVFLLAAGLLAPFLTRHPWVVVDHYREWLSHMAQTGSERWPGFRDGWTVWVVMRHMAQGPTGAPPLLEPINSGVYRLVQLLTAGGALAWCVWQRRRTADPRRLTTMVLGMGLAWLMLFGPAVEHATYVLLAPVLNWALLEPNAPRRGRWVIVPAFILVMFLGWGVIAPSVMESVPLLLTVLPIGTTFFTCWLIGYGQVSLSPKRSAETLGVTGGAAKSVALPSA